jgi:hypothetical protein
MMCVPTALAHQVPALPHNEIALSKYTRLFQSDALPVTTLFSAHPPTLRTRILKACY